MKRLKYLISALSIVAVVLTGCEKELGFDEGGENLNVIAISMVASPDTTLEAIVARTYRTGVVGTEGTDVEETFLKAATMPIIAVSAATIVRRLAM